MPKLSGEELSKLYPRAKTYDEVQEEYRLREIQRRPTFVAAKIALYTSLAVPTVWITYFLVKRMVSSLFVEGANSGPVLAGVSFSMLTLLIGAATLYYLYTLTDDVASKVFLATAPLYLVLLLVFCACGALGALLVSMNYSLVLIVLPLTVSTFILSFATVSLFKRS